MPFSAILLVFKLLMFSFLQVCKFTDLQVHNSIDCPYFYGLSVKISDLLHLNNRANIAGLYITRIEKYMPYTYVYYFKESVLDAYLSG